MIPKISVIVPCYGVEKYLDRCVQSLLRQSLPEIEIILVDDQSPDRVPEMCDEYALLDSRIKVIHKKNGGLGFARNSGLDLASGEYVAFVDSDDFVDENMYATLYENAKHIDADIVFCNCVFFKDEKHFVSRMDVCQKTVFVGRREVDDFLLDVVGPAPSEKHDVKYMMSVWHALYRKSIFDEKSIRYVSERDLISEDIVFDIDFLRYAQKIVYIPDALYYYCDNGASLSRKKDLTRYERNKTLLRHVENLLSGLFPKNVYKNHFYRQKFVRLRSLLKDAFSCPELNLDPEYVLNDSFWDDMMDEYPYYQMDLKHRVFFWFLKKKNLFLLSLFLRVV